MLKGLPENGDIWLSKYKPRVLIINVDIYSVYFYSSWGSDLDKNCETTADFLDNYTYLGRAKHITTDLFKTENE